MAHKFIKDFKEGDTVDSIYLVREKFFDTTKNGDPYISLELVDRTGMVDARKWDAPKILFDSFNVDDFVKIRGRIEFYKKYPQIKLDNIEKADENKVDASLYIPTVNKDIDELYRILLKELNSVKNPYIKKLLDNIFSQEDIVNKFKRSPAATDFHHPYIGGLLEHSLSCVELAKLIASKYDGINIDLLIGGAGLHDIGKIDELSYKRTFYYADKGRLLGHIVIGANMVEKEIDKISGFPEELKNLILHIILSHHGEHEWGSPKRPMCMEAVIMHYIDNLDAKINGFRQFVTTYNDPHSSWTKHSKMFGEFLYKKSVEDL